MRADSAAFSQINNSDHKEPRLAVCLSFNAANDDVLWLTSDSDMDLPATASSSNTIHACLRATSNVSQKVNPIKATSSIGYSDFSLADINGLVSEYLRTKWINNKATSYKRVQSWMNYKDLNFDNDAVLLSTHSNVNKSFDGLEYIFQSQDLQRTTKQNIFTQQVTTLDVSVTKDQLALPVTDISKDGQQFQTFYHDDYYSDGTVGQEVGYVIIEANGNKEVVRWKNQLAIAISVAGTDISFAASDSSINSTSTDLSGFSSGQLLNVSGGTNTGAYIIDTVSANKLTLLALDGTTTTITTAAAGASIVLDAPVQFYNCTRGALATRQNAYDVDSSADADRKQKVTEFIYLEGPALKLAYEIYTGVVYGTAHTLPDNWHLGIDTSLISGATFTQYSDLWNPSITTNKSLYFAGLKERDAKQFIQEQLLLTRACLPYILTDGTIGIKRWPRVLANSSPVVILEKDDIRHLGAIKYIDESISDQLRIIWNYDFIQDRCTRGNIIVDQAVADEFTPQSEPVKLIFEGLHGSSTTIEELYETFNMLRDMYAGPVKTVQATVAHRYNGLQICDVVRLRLPEIYDHTNESIETLDSSFMVVGKNFNPITGDVVLDLIASTKVAGSVAYASGPDPVLNDSWYTSEGTNLNTLSGAYVSGGVLHLPNNDTITGDTDITNSAAIWYYDGDVTIDSSAILTITNNVQVRVKGHLTINGKITGVGQGLAGVAFSSANKYGAQGNAGYIGSTSGGGYINVSKGVMKSGRGAITPSLNSTFPPISLVNNGGALEIKDTDFRGSSGASGGGILNGTVLLSDGGNGGNSSAALMIISRGGSYGGTGSIDLSGSSGSAAPVYDTSSLGQWFEYPNNRPRIRGGHGGSGHPSGLLWLLDGKPGYVIEPENKLVADLPVTDPLASVVNQTSLTFPHAQLDYTNPVTGHYIGMPGRTLIDMKESCFRLQYIPASLTPTEDAPQTADTAASFGSITEAQNTPNTLSNDQSTTQINLNPPADTNYAYSNVYAKPAGADDSQYVLIGPAKNSVDFQATMNGASYDIKAHPVSIKDVESPNYIATTVTVSNAKGGAVLGTGNYLSIGQTAYDTGLGAWIEKTASGVKASFGDYSGPKVLIDTDAASIVEIIGKATIDEGYIGGWSIQSTYLTAGSGANSITLNTTGTYALWAGATSYATAPFRVTFAGAVYATNATVAGTITSANLTATGGTIGGATISSTKLYNGSNIEIDWSNKRWSINSSTFGASGMQFQYNEGSPQLYVGNGSDKYFKYTTAGGPEWGAGTIKEAVFEMYTSGLIQNNSDPATNGGFKLETGGLTFWDSGGNQTLKLGATYGSIITGSGSGKRIEINPNSDNELHFYDSVAEAATIGINTSGADTVIGLFGHSSSTYIPIKAISTVSTAWLATTAHAGKFAFTGTSGTGVFIDQTGGPTSGYGLLLQSNVPGYSGAYIQNTHTSSPTAYALTADATYAPGLRVRTDSTVYGPLLILPKSNTTLPTTGGAGQFVVLSDGKLYFHNGSSWNYMAG